MLTEYGNTLGIVYHNDEIITGKGSHEGKERKWKIVLNKSRSFPFEL